MTITITTQVQMLRIYEYKIELHSGQSSLFHSKLDPALTKLALDLYVKKCMCVCTVVCLCSVFPVFVTRHLIGWYTGF